MSSALRNAAEEMEREVAALVLPMASAIRATGAARGRRRVLVTVGLAAIGVAAVLAGALYPRPTAAPPTPAASPSVAEGCRAHVGATAAPSRFDVTVFMKLDATKSDKDGVARALARLGVVGPITFETRECAYERFREIYQDAGDLVESVRPESLPDAFRARFLDTVDLNAAIADLRTLPGVDMVSSWPVNPPAT